MLPFDIRYSLFDILRFTRAGAILSFLAGCAQITV